MTEDKQIIDGSYRKAIADELGYDCPEIVQEGLPEDEKRTLARALNLAPRAGINNAVIVLQSCGPL